MLLRASGQHQGSKIDLVAVIGEADGDGGITNGAILAAFAEAILGDDADRLDAAREGVRDALGNAALVDAGFPPARAPIGWEWCGSTPTAISTPPTPRPAATSTACPSPHWPGTACRK